MLKSILSTATDTATAATTAMTIAITRLWGLGLGFRASGCRREGSGLLVWGSDFQVAGASTIIVS